MLLAQRSYDATATVRVATGLTPGDSVRVDSVEYTDRLMNTYRELALSKPLRRAVARKARVADLPSLEVEIPANTELMEITVRADDARLAAVEANLAAAEVVRRARGFADRRAASTAHAFGLRLDALQQELVSARIELEAASAAGASLARITRLRERVALKEDAYTRLLEESVASQSAATSAASTVSVEQAARTPDSPSRPRRALMLLLGGFLGLVGGVGLAFLWQALDRRVYTRDEAAKLVGLSVLAQIPTGPKPRAMRLAQYRARFRRRLPLVVAITVAVTSLALGLSLVQGKTYQATAELLLHEDEPAPRLDPSEPSPEASGSPERVGPVNPALSLEAVAARVKKDTGVSATVEELRNRVSLDAREQADILRLTAVGSSPREAMQVANAFAQEAVAMRRESSQREVQRVIDAIDTKLAGLEPGSELADDFNRRREQLTVEKELRTGDLEVVRKASPPGSPSSPKLARNGVIGGAVGLLIGMLVARLVDRRYRRLEREYEVSETAEVFNRDSPQREAFATLRMNLTARNGGSFNRTILIASAEPQAGKSTVAANLGAAMARGGSRVVLVDADLRHPRLHRIFGLSNGTGLSTLLESDEPSPPAVINRFALETHVPKLSVMTAGGWPVEDPSERLTSSSMEAVIGALKASYDVVIIDTPALLSFSDAAELVSFADSVLLVVREGHSSRDGVRDAQEQLEAVRARNLGVVVNCSGQAPPTYYSSYRPGVPV